MGIQLPLAQVEDLLAQLGRANRHAVAEALLAWLSPHVALAQCAIFSFERPNRPQIVAMGDRSRTSVLPDIAQAYVTRYFRLDPALAVMKAARPAGGAGMAPAPRMLLHRQFPSDIAHPGYRHTCYEVPQVAERMAILAWYDQRYWMSVNLYRGVEHGPLSDAHRAHIAALAPTIVEAVRLHHTGRQLEQDLGELIHGNNPTVATYAKDDGVHVRHHDVGQVQRCVFGVALGGVQVGGGGCIVHRCAGEGHERGVGQRIAQMLEEPLLLNTPMAAGERRVKVREERAAARGLGVTLPEPFLQVAFLPLPVIPHLKITDLGLVDVDRFELVQD